MWTDEVEAVAISLWEAAMADRPKPGPVTLSSEERAALEALVRRRNAGQALVQRARIVLACGPSRVRPTRVSRASSRSAAPA